MEAKTIDLAYQIAINSYDAAAKRFDAIDTRIQTIVGVGLSVTLAMPVVFSALKLSLNSRWMIGAAVLFVFAVSLATYARLKGELTLLTPRVIHDKWLEFSEQEFKKTMLYFAGQHMEKNRDLIASKHRLLVIVNLIFFLELTALVVGVVFAHVRL